MPADERAELVAAADAMAERFPRAAARLRALAAPPVSPTARQLRRVVLRRLWREAYPNLTRTAAARVLAAAWGAWSPDGSEIPGTMEDGFARLARVGIAPLKWRQIADELDADFDCNCKQVAPSPGRWHR